MRALDQVDLALQSWGGLSERDLCRPTMTHRVAIVIIAVVTVGLGTASVVAGRAMRVAIEGQVPLHLQGVHVGPVVDFTLALAISILIGVLLPLHVPHAARLRVAGVWLMSLMMHNLVWLYPDVAARMYSEAWVAEVVSHSRPNSLYFGIGSLDLTALADMRATAEPEPTTVALREIVAPDLRRLLAADAPD